MSGVRGMDMSKCRACKAIAGGSPRRETGTLSQLNPSEFSQIRKKPSFSLEGLFFQILPSLPVTSYNNSNKNRVVVSLSLSPNVVFNKGISQHSFKI